ncbi:MAG: hypothetical protein JO301_16690 [Chitinophagaceae bacterium]|nr:hypothetical protein [Chitinophagaceae bacterium]
MRKLLLLFLFIASARDMQAQQKIVFEELRYASPINYLHTDTLRQRFLGRVNSLLLKYRNLPLADTTRLPMIDLSAAAETKPSPRPDPSDTSSLHLYMTIGEFYPRSFFSATNDPADSLLRKTAKTVFRIVVRLLKYDNTAVQNDILDVVVSHTKGAGIGNESPVVLLMPGTFVELMRASLNILLDPSHDITRIGMQVPPAFMTDNYISPLVEGKPRTFTVATEEFSQYLYAGEKQMLRMGKPVYEEIMLRGKKAQRYNDTLVTGIVNSPNFRHSDYVFLRQDCRDVLHDKNYLVKLVVQVDPANPDHLGEYMFTNFLPGSFHLLLSDRDTLATFAILRKVAGREQKQYPGRIYNGMDSASLVEIAALKTVWDVNYDYLVDGEILGKKFRVFCGGAGNRLKQIYLNGKLVCIAQGKFTPEVFVVFDATLSPVLFNQLLIVAFNRFLE